jgi:hypothetical protein
MKPNAFHLLFWAILLPILGRSQSTPPGSLGLKIYTNIIIENTESDFQDIVSGNELEKVSTVSVFEFGQFTPAFSIYHYNGHFSEIELASLFVRREDRVFIGELSGPFPGKTSAFSLGIRYGFNLNLSFDQESPVRPIIGLSAIPFLETSSSDPDNNAFYNVKQTSVGLMGQIVPRLMFHLTDFLVLDINVPVTAIEIRNQSLRLEGGSTQVGVQKESQTDVREFPDRVHIRIGAGVLF